MILVQITNKHGTIQRRYDEDISDIEFLLADADINGEAETGADILRRLHMRGMEVTALES